MDQDRLTTVAELWEAHRAAAFPGRLRGQDTAGVDMVMLDADVAGCVSRWLDGGGAIEARWWDVLATCERRLERVVPALSGHEASYYQRLLHMAVLVPVC